MKSIFQIWTGGFTRPEMKPRSGGRPSGLRFQVWVGIGLGLAGALLVGGAPLAGDILVADFEGPDYGAWQTTGEAFGLGPARGALPGQMPVSGFRGRGLVNSYNRGDETTGTLTSPPFPIERSYLAFLIGGGKDPEHACLRLRVAGQIARSATGPNDKPGGSEALEPGFWDVREFIGRTAVLEIVDAATGGWGHVNIDHITQTDRPPTAARMDPRREFKLTKTYLNLPIKNGAPKRVVTLLVGGRAVGKNEIELADAEPDWWAPMDVTAWRGRRAELRVDQLPADSLALRNVSQSRRMRGAADLYREPLRGQFHFSSRRGWNNDPNGLVFYRGEYHLFYQHNPYGWGWGNMHWGHAVSRDLTRWHELGIALRPDELGPMFSGSAVVDWGNTSGFGKPGRPPLVLIYTAAGDPAVQCLAYSTDGRHFTKYAGNPVLGQITRGNRDPKVLWHAPTRKWVMALYVRQDKRHTVHFLTSADLKTWQAAGQVEGLYECPDLFELPVADDPATKFWVVSGADSRYLLGAFNGERFAASTPLLPGHLGKGFYAAQTFSDIPARDGRRIQIGWFQTPTPGMPFNQSMTIPLELKLAATADGPRLTYHPVKELAALRARTHSFGPLRLSPGDPNPLAPIKAGLWEIQIEFTPDNTVELSLAVRGAVITYDAKTQEIIVNGQRAPAPLRSGRQRLSIYCDRVGLEVFASDGLTYVPMPFAPAADDLTLSLAVRNGTATVSTLQAHELKSAWEKKLFGR